ncbi:MAG: hypothetical protein HYS52_02035 [Candidatus Wildermuthbacteria bacterium]|nr:hypothetical protein [Candidatus Wildermuthbacteria bacterium]
MEKRKQKLTAQDIQDKIFRRMRKAKKLLLSSQFSTFLLELHGLSKVAR